MPHCIIRLEWESKRKMVYQSREKHHQYKGMKNRTMCPRKKMILNNRQNILRKHVWELQILDGHGHWGSHSAHNWPQRATLGTANGAGEAKGLLGTRLSALQCVSPLPHWECHVSIKVWVYTGLKGMLDGGWGRETIWDRLEDKGLVQDPSVNHTHKAPPEHQHQVAAA